MLYLHSIPLVFGILPILRLWSHPYERQLFARWIRHAWVVLRPFLGWICIILGILGMVLPVLQGFLFLMLGVALIGPRHPVVRHVRARYKYAIRRMSYAQNPTIRWLGKKSRLALAKMSHQVRQLHQRYERRLHAQRCIRLAIVPPDKIAQGLNHWRRRYDPAFQRQLPPHIVLIAAGKVVQRRDFEKHLAQVIAQTPSFELSLNQILIAETEDRVVVRVEQGALQVKQLRIALEPALFNLPVWQRAAWPCLTLAKLRSQQSLYDAGNSIQAEWQPVTWLVQDIVLFEEQWGYIWHPVRRYRLDIES